MIKLIVKYRYQKWKGSSYEYPTRAEVIAFDKIEQVNNNNIERLLNTGSCVEITDIQQVNLN